MTSDNDQVSNVQRAFWVFLGFTLVAPLFAGLVVVAVLVAAPLLQLSPLLPTGLPNAGQAGVTAFIWSAMPAAVSGLLLASLVLREGTFSLLWAAAAGIVSFTLAALFLPFGFPTLLTPLALLAGLIAVATRYAMAAGGIITDGTA